MGSTNFGNFEAFCRDSTLPVCNVLGEYEFRGTQQGGWRGCELRGLALNNGSDNLGNLGSILLCGIAILVTGYLLFRSNQKKAAVGRREMQLFLIGYIIISVCEIFTVGDFPINSSVTIAFTGIHVGMIIATTWILMLNAVVGYQIVDDGTPISVGLMLLSGLALFVGAGYVALDTGFRWTTQWSESYAAPYRNIALYVLYQLAPLVFLVAFYVLEAILVLKILGELRPMIYLTGAAVLFAIGQVFNYVVSPHICTGTTSAIDGSLFQTLFTLLSVVMVWVFWSSITEDDWPITQATGYP